MGDFVRTGVMTTFLAGSSIGPVANVYGAGYQSRHIPPFSWGDKQYKEYRLEKAIEVNQEWFSTKEEVWSDVESKALTQFFHLMKSS